MAILSLGYLSLRSRFYSSAAAAFGILLFALIAPPRFAAVDLRSGQRLEAYREGVMSSVAVLQETNGQRVLKVSNRFQMGGTAARIAEQRHADIPLLLHPNPRRALFLGLGTGITFSTSKFHPNLRADGVELLPEVVELMPLFAATEDRSQQSSALTTHVADARRFVQSITNLYDVIEADLFHPAQDGAGLLYSCEHFRAIQQRLAPGGLFCQWLPLYQLNEPVLRTIVRTFLDVFPKGEGWLLRFNVDTPVLGLMARDTSRARWDFPEDPILRDHLKKVGLNDAVRLLGCFLADSRELQNFARDSDNRLNTDDNNRVVFEAPRSTYVSPPAFEIILRLTDQFRSDATGFLSPGDLQARVQEFIRARNIYLRGLAAEEQGKAPDAIESYIESARLSPEFTMGYAQCLTIATALSKTNPQAARSILERLNAVRPERTVARELLERLQ
jgi:spermidine synthase